MVWPTALSAEGAALGLAQWAYALLDRVKCFDRLLAWIISGIMTALGGDRGVAGALRRLYIGFLRTFRVGPWCGGFWTATNGMGQGCALSVLGVNLLFVVWILRLRRRAPEAKPAAYIDDGIVRVPEGKKEELQVVVEETERLDLLSGQKLNRPKCKGAGTSKLARQEAAEVLGDGVVQIHVRNRLRLELV